MDSRTIRETVILLPGEEPDDLEPVNGIPRDKSSVTDRLISGEDWTRTKITECLIARSWFVSANLDGAEQSGSAIERCVFKGSSLIGSRWQEVTLKNVIFENCRLDYAAFMAVRATGPVAFLGCSLAEASFERCTMPALVLDGCKLTATTLDACDFRGADLRGNDMTQITGLTSLRGVTLSERQLTEVAELATRELDLRITRDPL